jgi:hypothetical protein
MYRGRPLGADTSGRSWGYQRKGGYPPKMLQEIMGHARMTTTLDLYTCTPTRWTSTPTA